jgi:hypothetical protein
LTILKKLFKDERGWGTPEWLILMAVGGAIATMVVGTLLPGVQSAHNTVVNRVTKITGSGF